MMTDAQQKLLVKVVVDGLKPLIEEHHEKLMLSAVSPRDRVVTHGELQNFIRRFSNQPNGKDEMEVL